MKNKSSKRVALYAVLTVVALLFGYIEMLFPLDFIAPGMKLGLANAVPLFLLLKGEKTAAVFVNIARILFSALLFGNLFALTFSLTAGILSVLTMLFLTGFNKIGVVGISVFGSTVHNVTQLIVALFIVGDGVWYYLPLLLVIGSATGIVIGVFTYILNKKTARLFSCF